LNANAPNAQTAGGCIDYERYSHWAKGVNAAFDCLAADGWYLYGVAGGLGGGITIFDVHDPESPKQVGNGPTGVSDGHLVVSGHHAYVIGDAGGTSRLTIEDVSDPRAPIISGAIDVSDVASNIAIAGTHVCVTTNWTTPARSSVQVIDVANPSSPTIVGHLDLNVGSLGGLAVYGSHVFVALNSVLLVVSIANPAQPAVTAALQLAGYCSAIRVDGSLAFAVTDSGLQVIDISTPNAPAVLATTQTPGSDVALAGPVACVLGNNILTVIDVASPASPIVTSSFNIGGFGFPVTVAATGSNAYVATNRYDELGIATLQVIALSTASAPSPVGSLAGVGGVVAVQDSHAYVISPTALRIVDVSTPGSPTLAGSVALPGNCQDISVSGSHAYVVGTNPNSSIGGHLHVVDISNSAAPSLVGSIDIGRPCGVYSQGSYVFIGDDNGLKIVDASTPSVPVIVRQRPFGAVHLMTMAASRAYLYISDYPPSPTETVWAINLNDPPYDALAWQGDEVLGVAGVAVSGSLIYTSIGHPDNPPVLTVGNMPTPDDSPVYVTQVRPRGTGRLIADGNFLYLLDEGMRAHLIDVSTPSNPRFVGDVSPCGPNLVVNGQYIYTAPGDFYVLHAQCGGHTTGVTSARAKPTFDVSTFPNPFNPDTRIAFEVPAAGVVTVGIYDVQGRRIASLLDNQRTTAGLHNVSWDGRTTGGSQAASGVYFVRVEQNGHVVARKVSLVK
jgi:hypothetical protein